MVAIILQGEKGIQLSYWDLPLCHSGKSSCPIDRALEGKLQSYLMANGSYKAIKLLESQIQCHRFFSTYGHKQAVEYI